MMIKREESDILIDHYFVENTKQRTFKMDSELISPLIKNILDPDLYEDNDMEIIYTSHLDSEPTNTEIVTDIVKNYETTINEYKEKLTSIQQELNDVKKKSEEDLDCLIYVYNQELEVKDSNIKNIFERLSKSNDLIEKLFGIIDYMRDEKKLINKFTYTNSHSFN